MNEEDDLESLQIEAERLGNFYLETIKGEYTREKEEAADPIYKELNIVRCKIAHLKCPTYPNHPDLEARLVEKDKQNQEDVEFNAFVNNGEEVGPPGEIIEEPTENEQPEVSEGPA